MLWSLAKAEMPITALLEPLSLLALERIHSLAEQELSNIL